MNAAEFFAAFGIFVSIWWIGRRVAHALDRYELMKEQRRKIEGNGHRDKMGRQRNTEMPRNTEKLSFPVHPRPSGWR